MHGAGGARLVERDQPVLGTTQRVVAGQVLPGAAGRAGPLALEDDQPHPGDSSHRRIRSSSSALVRDGPGAAATVSAPSRSSARPAGVTPGGISPGSPSRPWRTTWTAHRPWSSRPGGDDPGQPASALGAGAGGAAQEGASRSRWAPASSYLIAGQSGHPSAQRRHHLGRIAGDGLAQPAHQVGVGRLVDAAVARGEAATHLGQHAGRAEGCSGSRSLHWRTGKVSWSAARQRSATLREENGPR